MESPIYSLAELLSMATPHAVGAFSPLEQQPYLAVDLNSASPLPAIDRRAGLFDWLQRQPCPTIAIGPELHPLARAFDVLLPDDRELGLIVKNIAQNPIAALVLVQVLRNTESMPTAAALLVESLGYATLQTGPEFERWLSTQPATMSTTTNENEPSLLLQRDANILRVRLNRPERRNAISVEMRDALYEALQLIVADESIGAVEISGNGACFSIGGALEEFGSASDGATAHTIRTLRLPANLLALCADRIAFHVHSACIGAGIEIPAFGHRITATGNAFFQLPELRFGLIPGAGGCISLPRRIGRQRTAYMALTMKKINATTALQWGLIDSIGD